MELEKLSIASFAEGLKEKKFSAEEVTRAYFAEIAARDKNLHSYLFVDEEGALDAARAVDAEIAKGEGRGKPLLGVPLCVKDNILVENWPTTAGSKILEPYVASYEATVVSRLRRAGAIFLGKTNLDEFAMGSSTERSAFGPTKNPRDPSRVPGGSSGGSAAAVAANLALGALGSDTGGSIRQPAAFTGVVGLKPTYGRVSRHGLIAMASSLDQIGPLAKSVTDAALTYQTMAGLDRYDATTHASPIEPLQKRGDLRGVRIGVPKEYFAEGLDPRVASSIRAALKKFSDGGAAIVDITLPHARYALACYYIVMPAEVSANVARFDGLRYGFVSERAQTLSQLYHNTRDEGFGDEVKRRIITGTYVLSHGYYDAYYVKAENVRALIRKDFEAAFKNVDVLMGPTTPSVAFKAGTKSSDPLAMYLEDIYTVSANLSGVPALSIPCGEVIDEGSVLPVGLQIIGKWFDESHLLGIAEACEQILQNRG